MKPHVFPSPCGPNPKGGVRTDAPRVALYSHDTMGLGHLRRNILIATALSESPLFANVLVISGAREACHFAMKAGVDCVTLPSLCKDADGDYAGKHLRWSCQQTTDLRAKVIAASVEAFDPDVLIVDKVPRGIKNELDPTLQRIRKRGKTQCVLGLREVLDDPEIVMRQWLACAAEKAIRDHYDEIWIYGDSNVFDSVGQYAFSSYAAEHAFYLGYLHQQKRLDSDTRILRGFDANKSTAVCVVGGGQDGVNLASAFVQARMPDGWNGVMITGPYMPEADRHHLRHRIGNRDDCLLIEDIVEADQYIAAADRVVSMAGYNTISSILSFGKPALVIPRIVPRREQWIRAHQFSDRGLLTVLETGKVSPEAISSWIKTPHVPTAKNNSVDMSGLNRVVERVCKLLPQRSSLPLSAF